MCNAAGKRFSRTRLALPIHGLAPRLRVAERRVGAICEICRAGHHRRSLSPGRNALQYREDLQIYKEEVGELEVNRIAELHRLALRGYDACSAGDELNATTRSGTALTKAAWLRLKPHAELNDPMVIGDQNAEHSTEACTVSLAASFRTLTAFLYWARNARHHR
jgi:hypothetical protein